MKSHAPRDPVLDALKARGSRIENVRYRQNRAVLLSISRDGRTLNSHACFREAPPRVVRAITSFVAAPRRSAEYREALEVIQSWEGARQGLRAAQRARPRRQPRPNQRDTAPVRTLFGRFNQARFGGLLPDIPLRLSRRMKRTLGTIAYDGGDGRRRVREIALSADLLLPANRAVLEDTLLHEMAHAEAWLRHGHRGHGAPWRRVAERVGCTPRALTRTRIRRRP